MKKVLITGAGGFIGSHLVEECLKQDLEVIAFVHYNSNNSWGWLESLDLDKNIEIVSGDIRDYDSVYNVINKGCDTIFHLAALIGIPYSYVSPLAYIKTNIEGTYNVLQAARELSIKNVLITSTSETYGTAQYIPIDELHPLVGQSPYSASKISSDQIALSYFNSFDLPIKIVRPFNTYGPRQSARAIIPTIISQLIDGKKEIKLGNLNPSRDLTYVKDTVRGFYEIAQCSDLFGEVTNIGVNKEISIEKLFKLIKNIMNIEIILKLENERIRPVNSEVDRLLCSNEKIVNYTNWIPKYSIKDGLIETINWMKKNKNLYKASIYIV